MTEHKSGVVEYVGEQEGEPLPCFVHHEDAGGRCKRPAASEVYGLNFCEAHGEEVRIGALLREHYEAWVFFERFGAEHVPTMRGLIGRELRAVAKRLHEESPTDEEHSRALGNAYPSEAAPEYLCEQVLILERDSEGGPTPLDLFLNSLNTVHTLMRIAYEDRETSLVEVLELERESLAAQAALADDRDKIRR